MQQDRDKAYNLANEQAERLGLPKLKGTEKQVRWATVFNLYDIKSIINDIIYKEVKSSYYINIRDEDVYNIIYNRYKEGLK